LEAVSATASVRPNETALRLTPVAEVDAHEGPVYVPGHDALFFTTVPRRDRSGVPKVQIKRLTLKGEVRTVRADANAANGMTLARDGRLLVCEQGGPATPARITALDPDSGEVETVVDNWYDLRLNSPNDVVEARDGGIWFTDPRYGFLQGFRPDSLLGDRVYRFDPESGRLNVVADSLDKPNGLAFSPDGGTLYVTDSGANQEPDSFYEDRPHHVVAFDVMPLSGRLRNERVFAEISPGFPDGIKCDSEGRVYVSSFSGVQVFAPDGSRLGEIPVPGAVNFCFGGPERNVLFITDDSAVWAAELEAKGA
jgi:gluconolactonase